jgi:signal transduction histidine kinase
VESSSQRPSLQIDEDGRRTRHIIRRLHEKLEDYEEYNFTSTERTALNIFFDLAQEFPDVEDLYSVITAIPKVLFDLCCNLHLLGPDSRFTPAKMICEGSLPPDDAIRLDGDEPCQPVLQDGHLYLPIKANLELIEELPFKPRHGIIGALEIFPAEHLSDHQRLFFEKFANRIGFQLHNRLSLLKNREHLSFIRNLVQDIGHNVIVPNMYFKLLFSKLKARLDELNHIQEQTYRAVEMGRGEEASNELSYRLGELHNSMDTLFQEIQSHYEQTSMFLETLLRRSHFEQGRYVLEPRECNLLKQVIQPQLERHQSRFREAGIQVDLSMGGIPDQHIRLVADVGLLSQVYANLFSNAIKYAETVTLPDGREGRFISFGWDVLDDVFGEGRPGVKLNVFSTGTPLPKEEAEKLFTPGFRGENVGRRQGSGHGLSFVKQVVELHGGYVGFEPSSVGNNFFFVLPFQPAS